MKEIHFFTNLCNEEQTSENDLCDMNIDFVSTKNKIEDPNINIVKTTQLSFLRNTWGYIDQGYKIYIHNRDTVLEINAGMDIMGKEIKKGYDMSRLLIGGAFGELY